MKKVILVIIIILVVVAGTYWLLRRLEPGAPQANGGQVLVSQVTYACDNNRTIAAAFYQGPIELVPAGQPPVPNGRVALSLSDGRQLDLPQTIAADGLRYANSGESVIFWSRGNGAFLQENNAETYSGCLVLAPISGGLTNYYASSSAGFSIRYPSGYTVNSDYVYTELGPSKDIKGVKFVIPASFATGTNLSSFDTGVSVEEIPAAPACAANIFIYPPNTARSLSDNGVTYSVATTSGAGAGNFYEEEVWALPDTDPCVAVRYFIHSTNIGNYPPGVVTPFNRQALLDQFDLIRQSLVINQ